MRNRPSLDEWIRFLCKIWRVIIDHVTFPQNSFRKSGAKSKSPSESMWPEKYDWIKLFLRTYFFLLYALPQSVVNNLSSLKKKDARRGQHQYFQIVYWLEVLIYFKTCKQTRKKLYNCSCTETFMRYMTDRWPYRIFKSRDLSLFKRNSSFFSPHRLISLMKSYTYWNCYFYWR